MATSRTLLPFLLYALGILAGMLLEGVNGDTTLVSRREATETPPWAPPPPVCPPHYCADPKNSDHGKLKDCCVNPGGGLFCTNLKTDSIHCGNCHAKCSPVGGCCNGVCTDYQDDPNNCGGCGYKCHAPKRKHERHAPKCVNSVCSY